MDAKLNRTSLLFGVPGILAQIAGNIILRQPHAPPAAGFAVAIAGTVLLIIGLTFYARAKGHSGAWGLLGLLSIIGIIVLAILPDRRK